MAVEVSRNTELPPTGLRDTTIIPFTKESALDLAIHFFHNKDANAHKYHGSDTYLLGEMEIEGQLLIMLGQEHLFQFDPDKPTTIPYLKDLRPISSIGVASFLGSYRVAQEYCQESELRRARQKTEEVKPLELRLRGRRDRLEEILTNLGQEEKIKSIDSELRMRPDFIQWDKERNSRNKGETY